MIPIDRRRRPDVGTSAPGRAGRTASEHPHAACRDQDPTLWDTDHVEHGSLFHRCRKCLTALAVCGRCPVRRRCADEATATPDVYTIRGGWPMVPLVSNRPDGRAAPATECTQCGLPVLRGSQTRFCSVICGRIWTVRRSR